MKLKAGLFVFGIFFLYSQACLPKKNTENASQNSKTTAMALSKPSLANLIGQWRVCDSFPQGEIIGVKSSAITYEFTSKQEVIMKASYFADASCEQLFTEEMANNYFKEFEAINKAPAPDDVKASVRELALGIQETMNYSATPVAEGEIGALDFLSMKNPSFTSYRIVGEKLSVATVCRDLIEEGCEPIGESATNRAIEMSDAEVFLRTK